MDPLQYDDDDERPDKESRKGKGKGNTDFECPECNANNPVDDGFAVGSEVQCFYCGMEFKVVESGSRFKFKPI